MKKLIFPLLLVASLIKTTGSFAQATNVQDSLALVDLYDSTGGANWGTTWVLATPVNNWYGVTVKKGRVKGLSLIANNLVGVIPPSLGNLSELDTLFLSEQAISGNIPSSLGDLTKLVFLSLYNDELSGSIPVSLGNLSNLTYFDLSVNQLTDSIPSSLGNLTGLTDIYLYTNKLSGTIPSSLGNLSNLVTLSLLNNQLSGTIPAELGSLASLKYLYLSENQLTGAIPASFGNLSNLVYLYLDDNQLSGSIPSALGNLSNLYWAYMGGNQLSGSIPPELGNLSTAEVLDLDNNQLSGAIPAALGNLSNLGFLDLDNNQLTDSIPSALGNLLNIQEFLVANNKLSGTIPSSLDSFPLLVAFSEAYMDLSNNGFTFAGMEGMANAYSPIAFEDTFFYYSPQATIPLRYAGGNLSVSAGGTLANNTYYWSKDGTIYKAIAADSVLPVTENGSYSVIVVNSVANALALYSDTVGITTFPLKLLSFTATKQGTHNLLQWTTNNEVNSSYFGVERSSDGVNFTAIGNVNASGTSSSTKTYSLTDTKPTSGTNYYRLKMEDKDGQFTYSPIRTINETVSFAASIYPNPIQNNLSLNFNSNKAITVQVEIVDNEGKVVAIQQIQVAAGASTQGINTASLSNGTYYVRCITTDGETELKFVKE